MTSNTTLLIIGLFAAFIIMIYLLGKSKNTGRKWSTALLCVTLLSIISTISMGVNYLAAFTGKQDGISLTGWLARLIIGEARWSVELFFNYFEGFTALSIVLVMLYFIAVVYENKKTGRY